MSETLESTAGQLIPFTALGRDLFASIECSCPDPKWAESAVGYLFKTRVKLVGYCDDYFFDAVNGSPHTVECPNCRRKFEVQWTRGGVWVSNRE